MRIRPGRYLLWGAAGLVAVSWLTFVWPGVTWLLGGAALAAAGLALADYRDLCARRRSVSVERTLPPV
ncbi:MAG TPA: hypothetical protein VL475_04585, partial [Planctomycetaceae bacterium]|nr:hypothetical protein [Planctomycetaceae bacterium]